MHLVRKGRVSGFYTGCMVKDGHAPEWNCDDNGNLTKKGESGMTTAVQETVDWLRKFGRMTHNTGYLWMSNEAGALADKLAAERPILVEVDVEGGTVQAVKAPPGVIVKVNDYDIDVEVVDENLRTDCDGHDYVEAVYHGNGEWQE